MATINFATREIQAKVVYFGATGAGCTTNLEHLHQTVQSARKSRLHGLGLDDTDERSWFFEYATTGPIDGFALMMRVYCLPGGIALAVHREEVMADVDAIVLVADARTEKSRDNLEALMALEALLEGSHRELSRLPVVIQVNHTDADQARPPSDVVFDLNPFGFPVVPAVARASTGVLETHQEILAALRGRLRNTLSGQLPALVLTAIHDPRRASDGDLLQSHVASIQSRALVVPEVEEVEIAPGPPLELGEGPEVQVAFQPPELVGSHPVVVLAAGVEGDRVRVELVMERMNGGESLRTTIWLLNRPMDTPVTRSPPVQKREVPEGEVFDYLPPEESEEEYEEEDTPDLPGVTYGIMGVLAGVLIGLLSAYLVGVVS